jgi:hypothetical protein
MLNLTANPCLNAWEKLELECAKHEISLVGQEEIIGENLKTEIDLTKKNNAPTNDGCICISV